MQNKGRLTGLRSLLLLGVSSLGLCGVGHAQQSDTSSTKTRTSQLEEVVVTAERTRSSVQKTAIPLTVVSGEQIRSQAKNSFNDILAAVPGVQIDTVTPNNSTVIIRGIYPSVGTDPSASTNYDGVYQSNVGVTPVFDLARVEVLAGPQGTLYGRNATAGAVNIITNDPTAKFGGSASLQVGNYGQVRTEDVLNVPLLDNLWSRTALLYTRHDGYLSNGTDDENAYSGREKLLYRPFNNFTALFTVEYDHTGGHGTGDVPAPLSSHSNNPWYTPDPAGYQFGNKFSTNALLTWNTGLGVVTYQTAFYRFFTEANDDVLPTAADVATGTNSAAAGGDNYTQFTNELRIAAPADSVLKWQAGLYHFSYRQAVLPLIAPLPGSAPLVDGTTVTAAKTKTESSAAFGQVTYPILSTLRITGGLRYTEDTKSITDPVLDVPSGAYDYNLGVEKKKFPKLTYKIGAQYDLTPKSMLYVDYSTGFTSGGMNPIGSFQADYAPETVKSYELGIKNQLLSNRLRLNGDIYENDYNNYQLVAVGACIPSTCPYPNTTVSNAGKVRVRGAEGSAEWAFTPYDRLSASVAYNDARFLKFIDYVASASFGPNGPVFVYLPVDRSGEHLPQAPVWTETVGEQHVFPLATGATITLAADIRFSSSYTANITQDPDVLQGSYHKTEAHLTYDTASDLYSVTAYVNNLENVATRVSTFSVNGSSPRVAIAPPRTYGVTVTAKF